MAACFPRLKELSPGSTPGGQPWQDTFSVFDIPKSFAGFTFHAGTEQRQCLASRLYSVVLWYELPKVGIDQRVTLERVLPEAERFLSSVDLVLEVQHLLLLPKVLERGKRHRCSRVTAPDKIPAALIIVHLACTPLLPNNSLAHRKIQQNGGMM